MIIKAVKRCLELRREKIELRREHKKEMNRFDQVIEDQGIDFDEEPLDTDEYELTPENIKRIMDVYGIDQDAAENFMTVVGFLNSPDAKEIIELSMSQYKSTKRIVDRVEMLPELYKALMDVSTAILDGKIKTKPDKVRAWLTSTYAKAFKPNDSNFYAVLNELKNISNGMVAF